MYSNYAHRICRSSFVRPAGGLVNFTICARVCLVEDRMSFCLLANRNLIFPPVTYPSYEAFNMYSSGCNVKICSKSLLANLSFSLCFGLFKVILFTAQSYCIENPWSTNFMLVSNKINCITFFSTFGIRYLALVNFTKENSSSMWIYSH